MVENIRPANAIAETRNALPSGISPALAAVVNIPIAPRASPVEANRDASITRQSIIPPHRVSSESTVRNATEQKMASAAIEVLGGNQSVREKMGEFMAAASNLADVMPGNAELHCFITCKGYLNEFSAGPEHLLPVKSNLFHSALHASQRGCTVAGQALRDAFLIARRVSEGRFYFDASEIRRAEPLRGGNMPSLVLPSWLPYRALSVPEQSNGNTSHPMYVICRNNVMEAISSLGVLKVAELYSKFFNTLWETGSNQGKVCGRRTYAQMTPPWLRQNCIFIHGVNRDKSIPFTKGILPNKNAIRQRSNKILSCAILDTFLRREEPCRPFLQYLLQEGGVTISNNAESSDTNSELEPSARNHHGAIPVPTLPEQNTFTPLSNEE